MDAAAFVQPAALLISAGIAARAVVKEFRSLFGRRDLEIDQRTAEHQRPLWKANN